MIKLYIKHKNESARKVNSVGQTSCSEGFLSSLASHVRNIPRIKNTIRIVFDSSGGKLPSQIKVIKSILATYNRHLPKGHTVSYKENKFIYNIKQANVSHGVVKLSYFLIRSFAATNPKSFITFKEILKLKIPFFPALLMAQNRHHFFRAQCSEFRVYKLHKEYKTQKDIKEYLSKLNCKSANGVYNHIFSSSVYNSSKYLSLIQSGEYLEAYKKYGKCK